jgi:hypothetical protein
MSNVQQIIKRNAYTFAAAVFTLAAVLPSMIAAKPAAAATAQATERQITMGSSAVSASASYEVSFKAATAGAIQGIVVEYCSDSPIASSTSCTAPTGFSVGTSSPAVDSTNGKLTGSWSAASGGTSNNRLTFTKAGGDTLAQGDKVIFSTAGYTNPSVEGTFYARILTFATTANATGYTTGTLTNAIDAGGVALSITKSIGVTATVQETLMFCVRGDEPTAQCGGGSPTAPNVVLGTGSPLVLSTNAVDTAPVYFQLSTNAANGAIVRLKGDTLKSGTNSIPAIGSVSSALGTAGSEGFGLRVGNPNTPLGSEEGTVGAVAPYNNGSQWAFDSTETTSTYGDIIASSTGPVYDINKLVEIAARAKGSTPAGVYTTSLSLVAVGTY